MIDPDTFRAVLGRFATGVTVVTTRDAAGVDHGMTVSAFGSASLVPPLVVVCLDRTAHTLPVLLQAGFFAVNILAQGQEALSRRFAWQETGRFDGIGYTRGQTGAVLLEETLAWLECHVVASYEAGDHVLVIGEVDAADSQSERPLLYYRGGYAQLEAVTGLLTPARRRGSEILDRRNVEPGVATRSMRDVALANVLFGGRRAAIVELDDALRGVAGPVTLLDVGTGLGDIPAAARARGARQGVQLVSIGLDLSPELAAASREGVDHAVCASAFALPFADRSVDVVLASQMLHHFQEPEARRVLAELHRVARRRVIVSDLRRSWLAAAGIWLVSWVLRFHPVSRHDGVVSVLRGFTAQDLGALVQGAVGARPRVTRRLGWRVTASWAPA